MNIAYLGWGSLVWNPGELPIAGGWKRGGPILPIEFSRISKDNRLTLVIDGSVGVPVETFYANCSIFELPDAIERLRVREGRPHKKHIGHVGPTTSFNNSDVSPYYERISIWGCDHNFDAVIWTALPSNFTEAFSAPFSVDNALEYLSKLSSESLEKAIQYIQNTPDVVKTPFRSRFDEIWDGRSNRI